MVFFECLSRRRLYKTGGLGQRKVFCGKSGFVWVCPVVRVDPCLEKCDWTNNLMPMQICNVYQNSLKLFTRTSVSVCRNGAVCIYRWFRL